MAKSKSKTSGIPAPVRRDPTGRKYKSRSQREAENNRLVLIITGVLSGLVVLILAVSLLIDNVIDPNRAVATVGGQNISTRDFQRRVTFERWRTGTTLAALYQQLGPQYAAQFLGSPQSPYGQQYYNMLQPTSMGDAVLKQMTNELLIKQYADANNITVSEADINNKLYDFFGYQATPMTATPTITPSLTTTPLVSPTPTTTPTVTPAPSQTMTPTTTPYPTGIPTNTPGPTEQLQQFNKNSKNYFDQAAKATGLTEAEIRQIFAADALRTKVEEAVLGKPQDQQEQVRARHILVKSEDEGKDVMMALQAGEPFSNLAKAVSTDTGSKDQGGELGWTGKGKYAPEFEDAIWSDKAKVGDVVGPIKTQFGYHVIQIEGREKRTLGDSEKQQVYAKAFSDWLDKLSKDKNVQTYDAVWRERVPTTPTLADFGVPDNLASQGGGGPGAIPGLPGQ